MGMDLARGNQVYSISAAYWGKSLDLAEAFGWRRAGTLHPLVQWSADQEWDGNYWTNDWQRVTDEDAHQLGVALYKAAAAIEATVEMTDNQEGALARLEMDVGPDCSRFMTADQSAAAHMKSVDIGLGTAERLKLIADFVIRGAFEIG